MYKERRCLAVITARGGSKGLPGKNIRPLLGKPLIVWTIERALESRYLDRLIVSTDDEEIARTSRENGADVPFMRPPELAADHAGSVDVVVHAINFLKERGENFDYVALLEPTSPLRKEDDIDRAIETLVNHDRADALVTLGSIPLEHPWIAKKVDREGYMVPFVDESEDVKRRQELGVAYFPYGVIYLTSIESLLTQRSFYPIRTIPLYIERWQCYEIDDLCAFITVEAIMQNLSLVKG